MSRHMRTTVRLNDALLRQAKREAAKRGETLTSLIETGLRMVLAEAERKASHHRIELPLSTVGGGFRPGVDLTNNASLLDLMESGLPIEKLR
jgi:hypothetical protein